MRNGLLIRLYLHYPGLFRMTGPSNDVRASYIAVQCGDGWFPLIDVLSETVVKLGANVTDFYIREESSRLAISYKGAGDLRLWTILNAAEAFSARVCHVTGLPTDPVTAEALWFKSVPPETLTKKADKSGQSSDRTYMRDVKIGKTERLAPKYVPCIEDRRGWNKFEVEKFLRTWVPCIDFINIRPADFDLVDVITRIIVPRYSPHDRRSWSAPTKFLSITWTDDRGLTFDLDEDALRHGDPKEFVGMAGYNKEENPGS